MILKDLQLTNYRNYAKLNISFSPKINIIYGPNGSGKTNILESIYVLMLTKSHRTNAEENLIQAGKDQAKVQGTLQKQTSYNLEIILTPHNKKITIDNNQITKIGSYIEKMNIIIFCSDDLNLIKGSPAVRRHYLDLELCQISATYYLALNDYNKLIKIRNDYLKQISTGKTLDRNYFEILNSYIVEKSIFIYQMRNKYINQVNTNVTEIYKDITSLDNFQIKYKPDTITDQTPKTIKLQLTEALSNNIEKEIKQKSTLYGPHKDDFEFTLNNNNLKYYGSQGQQRIAVLTLKLSEIKLLKDYKQNNPILLLDDVFSELDNHKKNNLLKYINKDMQVIITTTDLDNINKTILKNANLIHINKGKIQNEVKK